MTEREQALESALAECKIGLIIFRLMVRNGDNAALFESSAALLELIDGVILKPEPTDQGAADYRERVLRRFGEEGED